MDWASDVYAGHGLLVGGGNSSGRGDMGDVLMMENSALARLGVGGLGNAMGPMVDGTTTYVTVMTDEQIELLRKQIAVYAVLCERIVEWHKSFSVRQQPLPAGMRLGNLYCDPLVASGQKMTTMSTRQRWTPTPMQLQILENIFDQGTGTPSKQKIREITALLSQYGQISETNVYNWFQNRRARVKRKKAVKLPDSAESQVGKRGGGGGSAAKRQACDGRPPVLLDGAMIHTPETSSDVHSANPETNGDEGFV